MKRRGRGVAGLSLAASAGLLGAYVGYPGLRKAHAATACTVTNSNDSGAGSLRGCLADVNTAGGGTITFAETANGTITLASDLPSVTLTSSVSIIGNGSSNTVIDGVSNFSGFDFDGAVSVVLSGLKIQNTSSDYGAAIRTRSGATLSVSNAYFSGNSITNGDGGAIRSSGDATISNSTFYNNSTVGDADGGAIETSSGHITVTDSTFTSNTAGDDGGAIRTTSGDITVSGSTFSTNSCSDDGGVFDTDTGSVTISNSTFTGNNSGDDGGVINSYAGTVSISNSTFTGDYSDDDGGLLDAYYGNVTVSGSTFTNVTSGNDGGVIYSNDGSVTVLNSTFTGSYSADYGGVIYSDDGLVTISNSTFTGSASVEDGGVIYSDAGDVRISDSTFTNSEAGDDGGVVDVYEGTVTISGSTFTGNSSDDDGGVIGTQDGAISVVNSTFTNNMAVNQGAIIAVEGSAGSASLNFVTIVGNTTNAGSSGAVDSAGDATVTNSIVYDNSGGDVRAGGSLSVSFSLFTSTSSVSPTVTDPSLIFGEDPLLGSLANNGGPTQTMMPGAGSPVLGVANASGAPATDQRGYTRTTNGRADMGAVERLGLPPDADPSQVPPPWLQAKGRVQREAVCPPGMDPSWAEWPNEGTGGWTCEWTTWWDLYDGFGGDWVTNPGFRWGQRTGS